MFYRKSKYFEMKVLNQGSLLSTDGIRVGLKISKFTEELDDDQKNRFQEILETNRYWYSGSGKKITEFKKAFLPKCLF